MSGPTDLDIVLDRLGAASSGMIKLLAQMPVGIIIAEAPGGRLLYANDRVEVIWRRPFFASAGVEEYTSYRAVHPDGRPFDPGDWPLSRVLKTGVAPEPERIEFIRGDGSHGFMLCSVAPVLNADGAFVAAVVMFHDITGQHIAEQRVRQVAEIASRVNRAHGRDDVALAVLDVAVSSAGAYGGALLSLSDDGEWFELIRSNGYPESQLEGSSFSGVNTGAVARCGAPQSRRLPLAT